MKEIHTVFTAKEANFNGCGTAQEGLEKIDSCRPGQLKNIEGNLNILGGNKTMGVSRPRPSGVIRGQGK